MVRSLSSRRIFRLDNDAFEALYDLSEDYPFTDVSIRAYALVELYETQHNGNTARTMCIGTSTLTGWRRAWLSDGADGITSDYDTIVGTRYTNLVLSHLMVHIMDKHTPADYGFDSDDWYVYQLQTVIHQLTDYTPPIARLTGCLERMEWHIDPIIPSAKARRKTEKREQADALIQEMLEASPFLKKLYDELMAKGE